MTSQSFIKNNYNKMLTPDEWSKLVGIVVLDPDGWDRSSEEDLIKPISLSDFINKAAHSTTNFNELYNDLCKELLRY